MSDEILKREEVCELFKITMPSLNYWVATNQIPYSRLGKRSIRFSKTRLMEWFKDREGVEYHYDKDQEATEN